MACASEEERFEAAVKIIGGLPKDGPFQPSNEMKLKFYALFKQASLGPCQTPQPAFWDVVNKAKWTAWKSLGDMSKEDAMRSYVELLKRVVETMTLDDNVQDFLEKIGPMFEVVNDDGLKETDALENDTSGAVGIVNDQTDTNGRSTPSAEDEKEWSSHVVHKADLEGHSEEEKFDDAADSHALTAVASASSDSHSPSSHRSTPGCCSGSTRVGENAAPRHQPAATALGQLLRELSELDEGSAGVTVDRVVSAWSRLRLSRAGPRDQDDPFVRRLRRRGRLAKGSAHSSVHHSPRRMSGASSNSSGGDSLSLGLDTRVGTVLLSMHRELFRVNRQLEILEDILVNQHRLIHRLTNASQTHHQEMGFFLKWSRRTIAFILAWPLVVHVVVTFFRSKLR